jgi:hypothetical protein
MTRYEIFIEAKAENTVAAKGTSFIVEKDGYKAAWVDGRAICRLGATGLPTVSGQPLDLEAGKYTVRKVFTLDKKAKATVVTVDALVELAASRGVDISKKVQALIGELQGAEPVEGDHA